MFSEDQPTPPMLNALALRLRSTCGARIGVLLPGFAVTRSPLPLRSAPPNRWWRDKTH
jgi:hypothetical protein